MIMSQVKRRRPQAAVVFVLCLMALFAASSFAQDAPLEFTLDINSPTIPLPPIFEPDIDLSGRGFHSDMTWPQELSATEAIEAWRKDIGFNGIYRFQYNLWAIHQLAKDNEAQKKLLSHYESMIKKINDAGGIVLLDLFGTPAGLGKVLDRRSIPWDLKAFKELVKGVMRELSCQKKYTIWYEVWNAPDLDAFFLGRKQEYLDMYRAVAEAAKELEDETKTKIFVGGPSATWWFQNFSGNTILNPEGSLIYELVKFCKHNGLKLDFISWHAYSTDPLAEKELTLYNKTPSALIREWLSYFNLDQKTPLIIDEWNYDSGDNILPARKETAFIGASFIPSRLKNMYEAAIDYQIFFSLEDFQGNKEGVVRNTGIFWLEQGQQEYKGGPKAAYNVFRMLHKLGDNLFQAPAKLADEFIGIIPTKSQDEIRLLIYNYINPQIFRDYLGRNISTCNAADRESLIKLIKSGALEKVKTKETDILGLRFNEKVSSLLKKALELHEQATKFMFYARTIKLQLQNVQEGYVYQKYTVDSSCSLNCDFAPVEEKEGVANGIFQETVTINPYSVTLIVLKKKTREVTEAAPQPAPAPAAVEQPQVISQPVEPAAEAVANTEKSDGEQ